MYKSSCQIYFLFTTTKWVVWLWRVKIHALKVYTCTERWQHINSQNYKYSVEAVLWYALCADPACSVLRKTSALFLFRQLINRINLLPLSVFRYWRFNEQSRSADRGYPKSISVWGTSVPSNPKGAFLSDDGGERCSFCVCVWEEGLWQTETCLKQRIRVWSVIRRRGGCGCDFELTCEMLLALLCIIGEEWFSVLTPRDANL